MNYVSSIGSLISVIGIIVFIYIIINAASGKNLLVDKKNSFYFFYLYQGYFMNLICKFLSVFFKDQGHILKGFGFNKKIVTTSKL